MTTAPFGRFRRPKQSLRTTTVVHLVYRETLVEQETRVEQETHSPEV